MSHADISLPSVSSLAGGEWFPASGTALKKYDPSTGQLLQEFSGSDASDVDRAVAAAKASQVGWGNATPDTRRDILWRIGELLDEHAEEFALMTSVESGLPRIATNGMAPLAAQYFKYYAGWSDKLGGEVVPIFPNRGFDYTLPVPFGVVAVVVPWNGPTVSIGQKVAPALAAGNAVVLKASELAPFVPTRFGQICEEAGLPPGVVNVIHGGAETGKLLVAHVGVDKVSFTGSIDAGRSVQAAAAVNVTPVLLELGGKSANLVFADADLDHAAMMAAFGGAIGASGQGCISPTRLLVEHTVYGEVLERIMAIAESVKPGDPCDPAVLMGPVISEGACQRILGVIKTAQDQKAGELLVGGGRVGGELADGFYVETTIFGDVDRTSELAQNEIFGPVLSVIPFEGEDEAIAVANDTRYGLAGYVYTNDLGRAHRVAGRLDAGYIGINGLPIVPPGAPFGGTKDSGYGREGGMTGLLEFTRSKNVFVEGLG